MSASVEENLGGIAEGSAPVLETLTQMTLNTLERIQGTLVAVAPVVGSARVVSAAGNALRALGLAEAIIEAADVDD